MERWQIVKAIAGSGKVGLQPDGGFIIMCRTCWTVPPRTGGRTQLHVRFRGDVWTVLDEWAVHLADYHPGVTAPCLRRLTRTGGARERVRASREREAAGREQEKSDEAQFWVELVEQAKQR